MDSSDADAGRSARARLVQLGTECGAESGTVLQINPELAPEIAALHLPVV